MPPKEPKFIGEVPVVNRLEGSESERQVVGTAKLEELPGGNVVAHIDMSGETAEILRRGFSFGAVSLDEPPRVDLRKFIDDELRKGIAETEEALQARIEEDLRGLETWQPQGILGSLGFVKDYSIGDIQLARPFDRTPGRPHRHGEQDDDEEDCTCPAGG